MRKALIIAPSWIGDTIMAQPLFARLQQRHPSLQLDALAPRWVAPVLRRMAGIGEIIDNPFGHGSLRLQNAGNWRGSWQPAATTVRWFLPNSAQIRTDSRFCRHSATDRLYRRSALRSDQPATPPPVQALPLMLERFMQLAEIPGATLERPCPIPFCSQHRSSRRKHWPPSACGARTKSPPFARAPNTVRPSAGPPRILLNSPACWRRRAISAGCLVRPKITPLPKRSASWRRAAA